MSNPVINAFFFGRALAEVVNEKLQETLTNVLSDLGKFDAEQREKLREFTEEVKARAEAQASQTGNLVPVNGSGSISEDLQETIDELRHEMARLRAELSKYRQEKGK